MHSIEGGSHWGGGGGHNDTKTKNVMELLRVAILVRKHLPGNIVRLFINNWESISGACMRLFLEAPWSF